MLKPWIFSQVYFDLLALDVLYDVWSSGLLLLRHQFNIQIELPWSIQLAPCVWADGSFEGLAAGDGTELGHVFAVARLRLRQEGRSLWDIIRLTLVQVLAAIYKVLQRPIPLRVRFAKDLLAKDPLLLRAVAPVGLNLTPDVLLELLLGEVLINLDVKFLQVEEEL